MSDKKLFILHGHWDIEGVPGDCGVRIFMVSESEDVVKEHLVRIFKGEAEKWIAESFDMGKADFASTHLTATTNDFVGYICIYITEEKLESPENAIPASWKSF